MTHSDRIYALRAQAEEDRAWRSSQPIPWRVNFDRPAKGLFSYGRDDGLAVARTLFGMRIKFKAFKTDAEGYTWWQFEHELADMAVEEHDVRAILRCALATRLHGTYRRAGDKEHVKTF